MTLIGCENNISLIKNHAMLLFFKFIQKQLMTLYLILLNDKIKHHTIF